MKDENLRVSAPRTRNPSLTEDLDTAENQNDIVETKGGERRRKLRGLFKEEIVGKELEEEKKGDSELSRKMEVVKSLPNLRGDALIDFVRNRLRSRKGIVEIALYKWTPSQKASISRETMGARIVGSLDRMAEFLGKKLDRENVAGVSCKLASSGRLEAAVEVYTDPNPPKSGAGTYPKVEIGFIR